MKDFLEQYKVKLIVRGPVFVGSGREFNKKEYIFLPGRRVGILDIERMYQFMKKKGRIRQFEDFMMSSYSDLGKWLDKERLQGEVAKNCLAYSLDSGDTATRGQRTQIMACMKDPLGNPYVPGSTLKGMFRSILATEQLIRNTKLREEMQQEVQRELPQARGRRQCLSRTAVRLEEKMFRTLKREDTRPTDAVNDVLAGFVVSDSAPVDRRKLVLAQKVERRKDGTEKVLNLLRESICPGTEIHFTITVDHSLCSVTKDTLLKAIEDFDDAYSDNFLRAYQGMDQLRPPQVYVGGGTGFLSKTLVYPLMGRSAGIDTTVKIFEKTGVPVQHKHRGDKQLGVSPHILKCTRYQGSTLQMGLCDISIQ